MKLMSNHLPNATVTEIAIVVQDAIAVTKTMVIAEGITQKAAAIGGAKKPTERCDTTTAEETEAAEVESESTRDITVTGIAMKI